MESATRQEGGRQSGRRVHRSCSRRVLLVAIITAAMMSTSAAAVVGTVQPDLAGETIVRQADASSPTPPPTNTSPSRGVETAPTPTEPVNTIEPTPSAPAPGWAPQQEASVSIPRLGISLPVHMGGQEVIDQGVAAHYSGPVSRPPASLGDAGTYWLAGHHSTHGKPFARLPESTVGDQVVVTNRQGVSFTYAVTSTLVVGTKADRSVIYGTDPSARRILLQTCLGNTRRLLVHGTLTAVS